MKTKIKKNRLHNRYGDRKRKYRDCDANLTTISDRRNRIAFNPQFSLFISTRLLNQKHYE